MFVILIRNGLIWWTIKIKKIKKKKIKNKGNTHIKNNIKKFKNI
jgi:hypothetical protein